MPAAINPMPASSACSTEMPITPRETARMVAAAGTTSSSPRSGLSRRENRLTASASAGAGENRNPATRTAMINFKIPRPVSAPARSNPQPQALAAMGADEQDRAAERRQQRNHRVEGGAQVRRGQTPELIDRCADQRPVF